ncbi:MAG: MFS transporter [Actinomycetota bacterium]
MIDTAALRRRSARVLFASVALGTTSFVASITVAPLAGEDLSRSATLSGLPWTAGVLGTGLGSALLSLLMARRGRAPGLAIGYAFGAAGALIAVVAIANGQFALFVPAILVMGVGNAANHLSRYAAADLYPPERRASGLSMVVWAGAIGGVAGPALLEPSSRVAMDAGLPRLGGPFVLAIAGCLLAVAAVVVLWRRSPAALVPHDSEVAPTGARLVDMWRGPRAQAALIALAVAQTVMVMIMAMTPVHMRSHGHGLGSVGLVISLHVFGMYGLSPVAGRIADRIGAIPTVLLGFGTLVVAAVGAAALPADAGPWLSIPLFGLGWGWSLSFVAGSALLTEGLAYADRARLQGATDSVVWTAAAVAGLGSGILVGEFGYAVLCVVGSVLVLGPVAMITGRRRALLPTGA